MRTILMSAAALALAACSPPASNTNNESAQTTQTSAAVAPTAEAPPSAPVAQMRLGRWSKLMTVMGQRTTEVECITTADLNQLAHDPNSSCMSANGFQRTAEGMVYEAECTGDGGGGHIRTVINGDMQNHYVVDSTMSGAGMPGGMHIHIEGAYQGACHGDE